MEGRVKWFSEKKGYGFIIGDDGTDRFFHVKGVLDSKVPARGEQVTFRPAEGNKGPRAEDVTRGAGGGAGDGVVNWIAAHRPAAFAIIGVVLAALVAVVWWAVTA